MTVALTELLLCTVCGSLLGSLFGYAAQLGLVWLMQDLIASILPSPSWRPVWIGSLTALIMVVGYSLPSVILLRNTPPARVLSRNFPAKPASYALSYLAAALALLAILGVLLQDARLVRYTAEFVLLTGAVLWAAGWTLVRLTSQLRGHAGTAWRYGLATLARRQSESVAQIMAFGLGLAVLLLLVVVRADVLDSWRSSLAPNTPNYFLINIQQEQIAALNDVFTLTGVHAPRYAPWVRARLIDINGIAVDKISYPTDRAKAFVEREQNLSWAARLPEDNQILSGHWWENTPAPHHWVSVASEYADELHLKVGDQLGVDVAGERISAQVANVRKVRWDSFRPNFFLLFSPGSLEGVTGSFMTSIHLADSQKPMLATLARNFSSITVFDVDALLTQIRGVINRATLAIEYVSLFTVISGIVVMLSAIQASRAERCFDAAILRTLGASRQLILWGVFSEFVTLGFMAGVIAAAIATLCGYLLAVDLFNVPYHFNIWVWVYGIFGGMVLVGLSGLLATWTVTTAPPSVILRRSA